MKIVREWYLLLQTMERHILWALSILPLSTNHLARHSVIRQTDIRDTYEKKRMILIRVYMCSDQMVWSRGAYYLTSWYHWYRVRKGIGVMRNRQKVLRYLWMHRSHHGRPWSRCWLLFGKYSRHDYVLPNLLGHTLKLCQSFIESFL